MVEVSSRFQRQESVESDASSTSSFGSSGEHEDPPTVPASMNVRDPTSTLPRPPDHNQPIYEPIFPLPDRRPDRNQLGRAESARVTVPRYRMAHYEDRSNKRHSYTDGNGFGDSEGRSTTESVQERGFRENRNPFNQIMTGAAAVNPSANNPFQELSAAERVMVRDTMYSHAVSETASVGTSSRDCDMMMGQAVTGAEGPVSLPSTGTPLPPEVPARSRHSIAESRPLSPKPPRAILRREATQDTIQRSQPTRDAQDVHTDPPTQSAQDRVNVRNSTVVPSPSPMDIVNSPTHANAPQIAESLYAEITETVNGQIPLREAQILKLQAEMSHQAGTLVRFAKRELQGSLALVDVGGAVYIAGWNKPQMKSHLHVGDRLLNICGRRVICASEAHKTIKSLVINQTVELTIQRMPYGRALAIRRNFDGENLGLIMENGTNEVHRVLEAGLVHSSGLPLMVSIFNDIFSIEYIRLGTISASSPYNECESIYSNELHSINQTAVYIHRFLLLWTEA